jgi:hypothetical protein
MKNIKQYEVFEALTETLTEDQIDWLNECAPGLWSVNPATGLVDVDGDFYCDQQNLTDFEGVRFGQVNGNFFCSFNDLASLEGAPQTVESFFCHNNRLTSLKGAPQTVKHFDCADNKLANLEGAPRTVGRNFTCRKNQLTSLEGSPRTVGGYFSCIENLLKSLEGAPLTINGNLYCNSNQLTSLEGAPRTVGGYLYFEDNPISEKTLESIFNLMQKGKSYQQALEEFWPEMDNDDRTLIYKDHSSLTQEEIRKYQALTAINKIKRYL